MELAFKIVLSLAFTAIWAFTMRWVWTQQVDPIETIARMAGKTVAGPDWVATRDATKIYQNGQPVGDINGSVQLGDDKVIFQRLINTGSLDQSRPFEYQRTTLQIQRINTMTGMMSGPTGVLSAVLDGVECRVIK
jgi:hypothetical protein